MNFDGPVRVTDAAASGVATVTVSFDAWKGAAVAPTSHSVPILPPKAGLKDEPIDPSLIASLIHPDRKSNIWMLGFSPDGTRLFAAGYPSGIVQFFEVASKQETNAFQTPPGLRGSADYALLTPDWKTLYVPIVKRSVKAFERDGKKARRVENAGQIRVWDVPSGKELASLQPPDGTAPVYAKLSPDGRLLVCIEQSGYEATGNSRPRDVTVAWDLATGKSRKLSDGSVVPFFTPDGKTIAATSNDREAKTSAAKLFDCISGKELASVSCTEKGRYLYADAIAPDGSVFAVSLGGLKGAPIEVWFLDARTLEMRGKLIGKGDPNGQGWGFGRFTSDSKRFIASDEVGNALLWDVAGKKLERTVPLGANRGNWRRLAVSPDSKYLAVAWMPKIDAEVADARDPDPRDLPQPRISLVDLAGRLPTRVLIAPHGFTGGLEFSPDGKMLAFGSAGAVHLFRVD